MADEQVKHLKPGEFKRLCGVRPETFAKMVEIMMSLQLVGLSVKFKIP